MMMSLPRERVTVICPGFDPWPHRAPVWVPEWWPHQEICHRFDFCENDASIFYKTSQNSDFSWARWVGDLLFDAWVLRSGLGNDLDLFFRSQTSVPTGNCLDRDMPCFLWPLTPCWVAGDPRLDWLVLWVAGDPRECRLVWLCLDVTSP